MKYSRIHYSPETLNDLDEIRDYIMFELENPSAADNTIHNILGKIDGLRDFSETGTPLSSVIELDSEFRFLFSGNYMVFYHMNNYDVYIDRILYKRRDYLRILFSEVEKDE